MRSAERKTPSSEVTSQQAGRLNFVLRPMKHPVPATVLYGVGREHGIEEGLRSVRSGDLARSRWLVRLYIHGPKK